jgi:DNA-binding transcriptional ArsR family regulator
MNPARQRAALDRTFHALSDATRRDMFEQLHAGPASAGALAAPFAMALPSIMKHLAVLEAAGLVRSDKNGRVRTYRMSPDALSMVEGWVASRRAMWQRNLDRLGQFLHDEGAGQKPARRKRTP